MSSQRQVAGRRRQGTGGQDGRVLATLFCMDQRDKLRNPLRRIARAVKGALTRHHADDEPVQTAQPATRRTGAEEHHARPAQRQTDIPMDALANAYTPAQTSLKAPFRATGQDVQNDQEHGRGPESERWRDEDVYTNKSGDPRIGTHGRTYEPNETEGESEWTRTRP